MDPKKLLTPADVAKLLGISIQTLAVWRCSERYPLSYIKVGSRVRYQIADVEAFKKRQTQTPAQRR